MVFYEAGVIARLIYATIPWRTMTVVNGIPLQLQLQQNLWGGGSWRVFLPVISNRQR